MHNHTTICSCEMWGMVMGAVYCAGAIFAFACVMVLMEQFVKNRKEVRNE